MASICLKATKRNNFWFSNGALFMSDTVVHFIGFFHTLLKVLWHSFLPWQTVYGREWIRHKSAGLVLRYGPEKVEWFDQINFFFICSMTYLDPFLLYNEVFWLDLDYFWSFCRLYLLPSNKQKLKTVKPCIS